MAPGPATGISLLGDLSVSVAGPLLALTTNEITNGTKEGRTRRGTRATRLAQSWPRTGRGPRPLCDLAFSLPGARKLSSGTLGTPAASPPVHRRSEALCGAGAGKGPGRPGGAGVSASRTRGGCVPRPKCALLQVPLQGRVLRSCPASGEIRRQPRARPCAWGRRTPSGGVDFPERSPR